MRIAALCFACDHTDAAGNICDEESPPESTWQAAITAAKANGWRIVTPRRDVTPERSYCPEHH